MGGGGMIFKKIYTPLKVLEIKLPNLWAYPLKFDELRWLPAGSASQLPGLGFSCHLAQVQRVPASQQHLQDIRDICQGVLQGRILVILKGHSTEFELIIHLNILRLNLKNLNPPKTDSNLETVKTNHVEPTMFKFGLCIHWKLQVN